MKNNKLASGDLKQTRSLLETNPSVATLLSGFIKQDSGISIERTERAHQNDRTSRQLNILLVDDSILIQKATSRSLIKAGHQVEVAQHGAECLKILESSQLAPSVYAFDLILMDLQMPVMDGFETTRRIRALEHAQAQAQAQTHALSSRNDSDNSGGCCVACPPTPTPPHILIIGVTANTEGEARSDCMECGMDGFLEKPLRMNTLQDYLSNELHFRVLL